MPAEPFDTRELVQVLLGRGWHWEGPRLLHPADHEFYLQYDAAGDRLAVSPALDAHLKLVILTPASRGRFWRDDPRRATPQRT